MKSVLFIFLLINSVAFSQDLIDVGIDEIFTIKNGFDSNDQVELIIDSTLPDACYRVGKTNYSIKNDTITITQTIRAKNIDGCNNNSRDILQFPAMPVRFTQVVNLGVLPSGAYKVIYKNKLGNTITKDLHIKAAVLQSVDDYYYAPITDVFVPALVLDSQNATMIMTGVINDSCLVYEPKDFKVEKQGNIFIVQPKVKFMTNQECVPVQKPLQAVLNLGRITDPGRFLIHVRSMSGQSINKTFSVEKEVVDRRRE